MLSCQSCPHLERLPPMTVPQMDSSTSSRHAPSDFLNCNSFSCMTHFFFSSQSHKYNQKFTYKTAWTSHSCRRKTEHFIVINVHCFCFFLKTVKLNCCVVWDCYVVLKKKKKSFLQSLEFLFHLILCFYSLKCLNWVFLYYIMESIFMIINVSFICIVV